MGYFPFFVELEDKTGLVVGGGQVALRKIGSLLPYGARLRIVAPEICPEIQSMEGLELCFRAFRQEDLESCSFAIAATDSRQVNHEVAVVCKNRNILVNVADDGEEGTFLFPALVRQGSLTVGISTGGKAPMASAYLKRQAAERIPENVDEILDYLAAHRKKLKQRFPEKRIRDRILARLCEICMDSGSVPDSGMTEAIISTLAENGGRDEG